MYLYTTTNEIHLMFWRVEKGNIKLIWVLFHIEYVKVKFSE